MATFKAGDTATVRTSGEVVFISSIRHTVEGQGHPFPVIAEVRRPIATRDGIKHVVEDFYLEELESQEDRLHRDYESFNRLYTTSAPIAVPDTQVSN